MSKQGFGSRVVGENQVGRTAAIRARLCVVVGVLLFGLTLGAWRGPSSGPETSGLASSSNRTAGANSSSVNVTSSDGTCRVSWLNTPLFTVENCNPSLIERWDPIAVGATAFEILSAPSCPATDSCEGSSFYAIAASESGTWHSPAFGQGYRLLHVIKKLDGLTLQLESIAGGLPSADFEVRMGDVRASLFTSSPEPPDEEPAILGTDDSCALTWGGRVWPIDGRCGEHSISQLYRLYASPEETGPLRAADTNFFMYGIATWGGGNAADGDDIYVAVVTGRDAWLTSKLAREARLKSARTTSDGIQLELDYFGRGGTTCTITAHSESCTEWKVPPPRKPKVVARRTKNIVGYLEFGTRMSGFAWVISDSTSHKEIGISEEGRCAVEANAGHTVRMRLLFETLDDGSTKRTCEQLRVLD